MKILNLIIALTFVVNTFVGQSITVPQTAIDQFNENFNLHQDATDIVWEKNVHGFTVNFDFNDKHRVVQFDESGNYKEDLVFISFEKLNETAAAYIEANFKKSEVVQCYRLSSITAPERNRVDVKVNGKDIVIFFRPNGDFHYQQ